MNTEERDICSRLTDPGFHQGGVSSTIDTVLSVNGVRVILYPSGKIDILTVDDDDRARECEARIRERYGELILNHRRTQYRSDERLLIEARVVLGVLMRANSDAEALEQALGAFEGLHKRTNELPSSIWRAAGFDAAASAIQRPTAGEKI